MGRLPVLVNARAGAGRVGSGQVDARTLVEALADEGWEAAVEVVEPEALPDAVRRHAGQAALGVAGGDGTLRTAARVLAGSATTLVPFPTGTLNHFSRRLGIDTVEAAARAVATGRTRTLPVGRANQHVFLNTAVLGLYPSLIERRQQLEPHLTRWPAVAVASAALLLRWPRIDLVANVSGDEMRLRTAMFWVGVGRGSFPAVHESPVPVSDERLEIVVLPGRGRRAALRLAAALIRRQRGGRSAMTRSMNVTRVSWLELDGTPPLLVALDGELRRIDPPLRVRLVPDALRVVAG